MPIFDTSVLIALFNEDDARHQDALRAAARPGPFVVPGVILSEFLGVVFRRAQALFTSSEAHSEMRATLQSLGSQPAISIREPYDHQLAAAMLDRFPRLSYPDAVAVSLSIEMGDELVTFDADQASAWSRAK